MKEIDPRLIAAAMMQYHYSPWAAMQPPPFVPPGSPLPPEASPHTPFVPPGSPMPPPTAEPMTNEQLMKMLDPGMGKGWRK